MNLTFMGFIQLCSAFLLCLSFLVLGFFWFYKRKTILKLIKKTPLWFLGLNLIILLYKLFLIPHIFTSRGAFGSWIMFYVKELSWAEVITHFRAPTQFILIKFFYDLFNGVGYDFIVNLHLIFAFLNILFIYWIIRLLFKSKKMAIFASLLYSFSLIVFIFSFTADYSNPALFFSIQALFWGALSFSKNEKGYLFPAIASTILAANARPEYIIFAFLFFIFIFLFIKKNKKILFFYSLALLPKTISSVHVYLTRTNRDLFMHEQFYNDPNLIQRGLNILITHRKLFMDNLYMNIREFFDFSSFTGILTIFTIAGLTLIIIKLFKGKLKKEHKKPLIFFVAYFIILFFYYAYLHKEGLHSNYKYIISLILPLSVLGAYFLKQLANKNILIPTFLLFFLFGSFSNTALFCNTKGIKHKLKSSFVTPESKIVEKEFKKYKELTYDNHLYNVFHSKEPDVKGNENTVFITSSNRTMLFAMPIKLDVHQVLYKDKGLIEQSVSKISDKTKESDIVYVSQSVFPFQCSYRISFADPQYFEEAILKYFSIEEKMISYHFNGDHVFLYKMKKK